MAIDRGPLNDQAARAATGAQLAASDPALSVWVEANAGAGKTRVLADRVVRLLLAGVEPGRILCLTFTKAAAAEMARRVSEHLAKWIATPDRELATELFRLGDKARDVKRARALFARTLEAPNRLRIQTIHAFCESLLHRFPLEAGVAPTFAVADEARAGELARTACDDALGDPTLAAPLAAIATRVEDTGFGELTKTILAKAPAPPPEDAVERLAKLLDVDPGGDEAALTAVFVAAAPRAALARAAAALASGGKRDGKNAAALARVLDGGAITDWCAAFLTGDLAPRAESQFASKGVIAAMPDVVSVMVAEQRRLLDHLDKLRAMRAFAMSVALVAVARRLTQGYAAAKGRAGVLDYDDLIRRARDLLRPELNPWVMFKLDGGIDHVLIDEAQDTSPTQWSIIDRLTDEFFAGEGQRPGPRTVFAVGDVKQSIMGFQGAAPEWFAKQQAVFQQRAKAAGAAFKPTGLTASYRSGPAILTFVDHVLSDPAVGMAVEHRPLYEGPSLVELWPLEEPTDGGDAAPWDAPLDYVDQKSPVARLADRIATTIKSWTEGGERLPALGRAVTAGDVLILVRKRDAFFTAIVRALKAKDVPVAGTDRMKLGEQIAVMDVLALARFALLPQDDLNLAALLKSPLLGVNEERLFDLAHGRSGRLWAALLARAEADGEWARVAAYLRDALRRADRMGPHAFLATTLAAGGRALLLARLGQEAVEPLEELLQAALDHEAAHPPSLQGFLAWFDANTTEIKRELEEARGEVRVMTVHGAKGLEAPIVFLPDTVGVPSHQHDPKLTWIDEVPLWSRGQKDDVPASVAAREQARAEAWREYMRLYYVALTRAADRLYICGHRGARDPDENSWYAIARRAFAALNPVTTIKEDGREILRFARGAGGPNPAIADKDARASPLPAWARAMAPAEPTPSKPLTPSTPPADDPPSLSPLGADQGRRFARGRLIHRLLQYLPDVAPPGRAAAAARLLRGEPGAEEIAASVFAVLDDPRFAAVFGPGSLAEVPLVGRVGADVVAGQIDRLVVTDREVLIIDFKSNRPPPDALAGVAPAYRRQMALYAALVAQIYPAKTVRAGLLWTTGPMLMEIPGDLAILS